MPNLLYKEKSPYLLQHADNPIDWFPWGEDAFLKAEKEDKPILLSIGYSTCYWCHKMAREAFSDEKIADYLNEYFVCVKVDREERPDIDLVYMEAALCMSENVGWPLNIFLTPDKKPFFVGMYFPVKKERGVVDFLSILKQIRSAWIKDKAEIYNTADEIMDELISRKHISEPISDKAIHDALWSMKSIFDNSFGGFGGAPKFPIAQQIFFLLRYWYLYRDEYALYMVEKTLDNIYQGEIYDKNNGGFFRYATTITWGSPHYEKMLYTNALMAMAYLEAYEVIGKEEYKNVVNETLGYIKKRLLSAEGGFYSAEDSEVVKGKLPFVDEKISSGLNGLMIASFAMAGKVFEEPKYILIAKEATNFILERLYKGRDTLSAYYIKGNSFREGYSTDYTYLIWGLIELYQATYEEQYLTEAINLNKKMIDQFWDNESGGILFYSKDSEKLIINPKEVYDGAIPSVNSVAAMNLIRLSRLKTDISLNKYAKEIFNAFGKSINKSPSDYLFMLCSILYEKSTKEVVIVEKDSDILNKFNGEFRPFTMEMPFQDFEQ